MNKDSAAYKIVSIDELGRVGNKYKIRLNLDDYVIYRGGEKRYYLQFELGPKWYGIITEDWNGQDIIVSLSQTKKVDVEFL